MMRWTAMTMVFVFFYLFFCADYLSLIPHSTLFLFAGQQTPQSQPQLHPPKESEDPIKETILQTSRLFLRNLAFSCTDADLLGLCQPFGEVSQVSFSASVSEILFRRPPVG